MGDITTKSPAAALVARLLRIPHEPEPPIGDHDSVRTFRAAKAFYRYQLALWGMKQVATFTGLAIGVFFLRLLPSFPYKFLLDIVELLALAFYLAVFALSYLMVHLNYQLRWYIVTDRSLRIREGLLNISEKTMSFANIQNISVRQGPLQRVFGIADVEVRTAGGGASHAGHEAGGTDMHLGYFRGVDNAEEIRDAILARVRDLRDSGLGDPDALAASHDVRALVATHDAPALEAARELLDETRALRLSLDSRA
jgi:membrane protein YdbS with pleckstrin-like domain